MNKDERVRELTRTKRGVQISRGHKKKSDMHSSLQMLVESISLRGCINMREYASMVFLGGYISI